MGIHGLSTDASGDDDVNLSVSQGMPRSLVWIQVEHRSIDVCHCPVPSCEELLKSFDGHLLNVRNEAEQPSEAFEFVDARAVRLHPCLGFDGRFLDLGTQSGEVTVHG